MNTFKSYLADKIVSINESKLYSRYKFIFSYKNKKVKMPIADYYNYRYQRGKDEYSVRSDIAKKFGLRKDRHHLVKMEPPKGVPVPSEGDIVIVNNKPYIIGGQKNHRDGNVSFGAVSADKFVEDVFKNKYSRVMFERRIDLYSDVDKIIKKDSSEYKKLISKIKKNKGIG